MISPSDCVRIIRSHAPGISTREALAATHDVYVAMPRCLYRSVAVRTLRCQLDAWLDHPYLESGRMDPVRVGVARRVLRRFLQENPELTSKYLAPARPTC